MVTLCALIQRQLDSWGVNLDTGLQFRAHKNLMLKKTRKVEDRVCRLGSTNRLQLGLIRKIQVTAV